MKTTQTIKKILIFLLIAVAGLVGYSVLTQQDSSEGPGLGSLSSVLQGSAEVNEREVELANSEILRVLGSIQNIELNDDIFSNPVFRDLRDTRFTIPKPLQIGRPNPFLPIGFDNVTIQTVQDEEELTEETPVEETPSEGEFFPAGQEV